MKHEILRSPAHNGIYALPAGAADSFLAQARNAGFAHARADVSDCHNLRSLLRSLGEQVAFPDWYAGNLDALHDCLIDPDWQPGQAMAKGYLVVITGLAELAHKHPEELQRLLDVFRSAAEIRRNDGTPFNVLADGAGGALTPLPER